MFKRPSESNIFTAKYLLFILAAAFLAIAFIPLISVYSSRAFADKPAAPSFKDILSDTDTDSGDIGLTTQKLIEDGRIVIEEVEEKIVIRWRGPKKNDLFAASIKARSKAAAGFHIYKSKNRYMNFVLLAKIDADSSGYYKYEDFELKNGVVYYYTIKLVDSDGGDNDFLPQFQAMARDINRPARPEKPSIENGDGFVRISWKPYTKNDFYEYQVLRAPLLQGQEHEIISRVRQSGICTFIDSEIVNGKSYSYMIRIVDKSGNLSRESNEAIGRPKDLKAPVVPHNLRAEPGNNMVTIAWERSADEDCEAYKIYFCEGEPSPSNKLKLLVKTPAKDSFINSYQVKDIKNGKIYYFSVSAVDYSGNESAQAFEVKGAPVDFMPPAAPSYIKVSAMNAANKIEWASVPDFDKDLSGYRIYRKSSAFPKYIAVADIKKPKKSAVQLFSAEKQKSGGRGPHSIDKFYPVIYEYIDDGLYNAMAYYYFVVAYDNKGNESKASQTGEGIPRDKTPPEKVSGFSASSRIAKTVLKWKPNKKDRDLLGYYIYRRADSQDKYSLIAEIKKPGQSEFEDINLDYGVKYFYRISAFDESLNESVASDEKSATAKFSNQISFSRAYIENRPYTYCFSVNLNEMSLSYSKSADNISWTQWSGSVKFPLPPNMGKMTQLSVQKWIKGFLIFSYNPQTLDLFFMNSADEKTFPDWRLLFNRVELPPNFGSRCYISFEKDENSIMCFSYNPLTRSVYHNISRDLESFLRWAPCGLKVAPPQSDSDMSKYCVTADDKGYYLFSYNLDDNELMQSYSFDKKHWKAWYKFARNIKKPKNLELNIKK